MHEDKAFALKQPSELRIPAHNVLSAMVEHTDPELQLLRRGLTVESSPGDRLQHELHNAPLFTHAALTQSSQAFQQRGLLGSILRQQGLGFPPTVQDERIYLNTSAPCSAVVCGVQGSGKSHTVSCLLECSLIADKHIGNLPEPLSAVVFHFDEDNGDRPCEAAYLAVPHPEHPTQTSVRNVTVLVSPSNLRTRRKVYAQIPNINVQPLYLSESDLSAGRMLSMMGGDDIDRMPLYMHTVLNMLRKMGSDDFDYKTFKQRLVDESGFTPIQLSMLKMRTDLLDSYLSDTAPSITSWFDHGKLVIVDLSDPFLDGPSASTLFEIVLGVFVEWRSHSRRSKKIIVLDEAHKYLNNNDNARLTKTLSSLIRQQRHLGIRIIVSTQEPTVVPAAILDLTSYIICHKFSSPSWCTHLKRHVSLDDGDTQLAPWVEEVMQLHTGEALLFSPNAVAVKAGSSNGETGVVARLGTGHLKILTRPRITLDGGFSIMAVDPDHPDGLSIAELSLNQMPATPPQTSPPTPMTLSSTQTPQTLSPASTNLSSPALQTSPPTSQTLSPILQTASTSMSGARPSSHSTPGAGTSQHASGSGHAGKSTPLQGHAELSLNQMPTPPPMTLSSTQTPQTLSPTSTSLSSIALQTSSPTSQSLSPIPQTASASIGGARPSSHSTPGGGTSQHASGSGHARKSAPATALQRASTSKAAVKGPFWELVGVLESFKKEGIRRPLRKQVSSRLDHTHPTVCQRSSGFQPHLTKAVRGGFVKIGPDQGKMQWISLP